MPKHITQSDLWAKFRLTTPNVKKVLNIDDNKIYIHKIPHLPFTVAYLPRPAEIKDVNKVIAECKKENAIYLKIEPTTILNLKFIISNSILPQHTIYIDLTKSEEELLKAMHEKTRYNIKLAQKKGVEVRQDSSPENLINLLEKTEKRQNFYSHPANYYRKIWQIIKPIVLTAYLEEKPIASIMLFNYETTLFYPYGGSDPAYREYQAPSLLHWEAIKLGEKLGCKIYDMWGSYKKSKDETDPWWGIYRFKSGFGGYEVDFPNSIDIPLCPLYYPFVLIDKIRWVLLKLFKN